MVKIGKATGDEERKLKRLIDINIKKLSELNKEHGLQFDEGRLEATDKRVIEILKKIVEFFKEIDIPILVVDRQQKSEYTNMQGGFPVLSYLGEVLKFDLLILPKDKSGKDKIDDTHINEIRKIESKISEWKARLEEK